MNPVKKITALLLIAALFVHQIPAQTTTSTPTQTNTPGAFDTTGFPQWVKDMRRFEIIAFGSFPFAMFTSSFAMDMYRWSNANGMDFSSEGRRYAPWPLKSAGAVGMDSDDMKKTLLIAAGLSVGVAVIDLVIVQIKRYRARKRAEALPAGTTIIIQKPLPEEPEPIPEGTDDNEAVEEEITADEDAPNGQP